MELMESFNFNKDAEILIYAYGKVGQGYRVIGIIDKYAERFEPVDNYAFWISLKISTGCYSFEYKICIIIICVIGDSITIEW